MEFLPSLKFNVGNVKQGKVVAGWRRKRRHPGGGDGGRRRGRRER